MTCRDTTHHNGGEDPKSMEKIKIKKEIKVHFCCGNSETKQMTKGEEEIEQGRAERSNSNKGTTQQGVHRDVSG